MFLLRSQSDGRTGVQANRRRGGNVWIELGNGQRIIIESIDKGVLDNSDFYFF